MDLDVKFKRNIPGFLFQRGQAIFRCGVGSVAFADRREQAMRGSLTKERSFPSGSGMPGEDGCHVQHTGRVAGQVVTEAG
jgi:hypothetical protein